MVATWLMLIAAIAIEVVSTASLPKSDGFRDPVWTAVVLGGYALSIWLLSVVVRELPVSVAYAVWSGLGTAGIAVIGFAFLGEPLGLVKAGGLALVIIGVVVLNLQGAH